MRYILIATLIFMCHLLRAQNITTVASTGVNGIEGMTIDSHGNLFITTYGNQIKKIDTNYNVSLIAGTGTAGFSGDSGLAISAKLNFPIGITVDSEDNIIFADVNNNRIRKIDISTNIITTIVGNGTLGFSGDGGAATLAAIHAPVGVCFDKFGNLYFSDQQNYRIRKINSLGIISTYAGNGLVGSVGDGSSATAARCWPTEGLIVDNSGSLYFTQNITYPTLRKVSVDGIITTIAGDTSSHVYDGDGVPATNAHMNAQFLALRQNGLLYLCDEAANNRVRYIDSAGIINTIVGNGVDANTGDGGPATAASIAGPTAIAFDGCGNLFIGDFDGNSIRKVTFDTSCTLSYGVDTTTLNVGTIYSGSNISVYPNPIFNELNVTASNKIGPITIYNLIGQVVYSQTYSAVKAEINMAAYPAGLYMLMITDEEGKKTIKKIVKQ